MLNIIKAYIFCITKFLKGEKPTRYRINKNKWLGFKIYQTSGGKLGEGFTVVCRGYKASSFPNYIRNGALRKNNYTAFKYIRGVMRYQHKKPLSSLAKREKALVVA
jgi:hypothetical protein|tara:strand:+ start:330 stop:647 length:318 start_codon:yes stop_codon:yes gene_type:complete